MTKTTKILLLAIVLYTCSSQLAVTWASGVPLTGHSAAVLVKEPRSNAPEPSTFLLFGSGVFTMCMAFLRRAYHIAKRIMDVFIAVIALIILSPLCILTAILIKLTSKGPVFYSQTRSGQHGEHFEIYKFRTMRTDAEKDSGPVWAKAKDNRITPIGNFLRKSRIDEIPQFINVLKGEMSVIGPRPERPIFVEKLEGQISDYKKRMAVKPGITGLAQVNHRYDETIADVRKKVKYDILYIKKICFATDIRIILRTFGVILTGFGAR
jgi:exopolysaccharide biosynthesis polyprenyl glycosylphosphotransferase